MILPVWMRIRTVARVEESVPWSGGRCQILQIAVRNSTYKPSGRIISTPSPMTRH